MYCSPCRPSLVLIILLLLGCREHCVACRRLEGQGCVPRSSGCGNMSPQHGFVQARRLSGAQPPRRFGPQAHWGPLYDGHLHCPRSYRSLLKSYSVAKPEPRRTAGGFSSQWPPGESGGRGSHLCLCCCSVLRVTGALQVSTAVRPRGDTDEPDFAALCFEHSNPACVDPPYLGWLLVTGPQHVSEGLPVSNCLGSGEQTLRV